MIAEENLYTCLRSILRSVSLCETFYQSTESNENSTNFGQKLIPAAANNHIRSHKDPKRITTFQALNLTGQTATIESS